MSSTPTYHKSPWTSKVNSFLYENSFPTLLDGILRHLLSLVDTRSVTTTTDTREDDQGARGMEDAKTVAWKRRRKRRKDPGGGSTAGLGGTTARELPPPLPLPLPPEMPLWSCFRYQLVPLAVPPPVPSRWEDSKTNRTSGTTAGLSGSTAAAGSTTGGGPYPLPTYPRWVNTINRTPLAQIWDRLCFEIRVELGSPPQDGLLPPLVGMVPPLVEKIPSWIQDLYL